MDNQTIGEEYQRMWVGLHLELDPSIVNDVKRIIDAYYQERFRQMIERAKPAWLEEPHDRPMPITEPHYIDGWNEGLGEYTANLLRELGVEEK